MLSQDFHAHHNPPILIQSRTNNTPNIIHPPPLNPLHCLLPIPAHMRLSHAARIEQALRPLQRHVRHTDDLVPQVLEAVRCVVVVSLAIKAKLLLYDELVVGVYCVV